MQSGVALVAVTGSVDARRTIALEGMQLVAANAGDLVPGHAGVLEVSARHFATVLTSGVLGTAIALALTLRLARILSAALAAMALSRGLRRMAALSVPSLLVVASTASAQVELVGRERLVGLVGPVGAEHMFAIAAREDWQRDDDLLSLGTGVETGLISYTSPIDSLTGGYVEVTPLSFLVLRAEVLGVGLWPIGMDGTGYHAVRGEVVDPSRLPSDEGRLAAGIDARVGATLQLAVQLGGLRPILFAQATAEYLRLGESDQYFSARYDAVLAREDWMVTSTAYAMIEGALRPHVALRIGVYDDLRAVPQSGRLSHTLGGVAMVVWSNPDPVLSELAIASRGGLHVDDTSRTGEWTTLIAVMAGYRLGAL